MERVVISQQLNTVYHSEGKVNTLELFSTDPAGKFIQFSAIKDSSRYYSVTIQVDDDGNIYTLNGDQKTKAAKSCTRGNTRFYLCNKYPGYKIV